jgi:DNA-binding NarL/FixJ family response regulator
VLTRLQGKLARKTRVDDLPWGLEAALNRLLTSSSLGRDAERTVRSESRNERHRARLRRMYLRAEEGASPHPHNALDARLQLRAIAAKVTPGERRLLQAVGEGYEYAEIATQMGYTAGALRVRVARLRRMLPGPCFGREVLGFGKRESGYVMEQ